MANNNRVSGHRHDDLSPIHCTQYAHRNIVRKMNVSISVGRLHLRIVAQVHRAHEGRQRKTAAATTINSTTKKVALIGSLFIQ